MSYSIFYNKQFVKLERNNEVIPMVLLGDNNCFDAVGPNHKSGRRSRDWQCFRYYNDSPSPSIDPLTLIRNVNADLQKTVEEHRRRDGEEEVTEEDVRKRWGWYTSLAISGYHTSATSWKMWFGLFKNGIDKALTIEQLHDLGIHLYFHTYNDRSSPEAGLIRTEDEYFAELEKWEKWRSEGDKRSFSLSFSPHNDELILQRLRSLRKRAPKPKTQIEQDHCFVLTDGEYGLVKYTRRGYRYSYTKSQAKRYRTEAEAERRRKSLVENKFYKAEQWKVERIEGRFIFDVDLNKEEPVAPQALF